MMHPFDRNVRLTQVISALVWGRFFIPVLALFYVASQVSLVEFGIIMGAFYAATLLLEIPSGAFADRIGRKNALIIGGVCYIVEVAILASLAGFWPFLIAKIISGIGVSLNSGTAESLLYDSLRVRKRERSYAKELGTMRALSRISMAFVFVIGAWLFSIDPKLPAWASIPFMAAGVLLTLFLVEPPARRGAHPFLKQIAVGLRTFFRDKELVRIFLFAIPLTALVAVAMNLSSVYLERTAYPVASIGAVAFIVSLCVAFVGRHAHAIIKRYGPAGTRLIVAASILLGVASMAALLPLVGLLPYVVIAMAGTLFAVYASDVVNARVKKDRTTMLSIQNMADNVGLVVLMPLSGVLGAWSFSGMWIALSAIGAFWILAVLLSR